MTTDPLLASTLRAFDTVFAAGEAHMLARAQAAAKPLSDEPRPTRIELIAIIAAEYGRSQATAEAWLVAEFAVERK